MIHAGKFKDTYFVLDVEGGALHEVDRTTWEAARLLEQGMCPEAAAQALEAQYPEVREALAELDALREQELLFTPCLFDPAQPVFRKPAIKSLCLHIAHDCNLRCAYCFAAEGTYRGKRAYMTREVARAALDFLMRQSQGRRQLEVDFFGGEPLINFDVVKDAVAYGRQLEKEFGKEIRFTMTTNAYHVTDEMADFINREMKNLVISVDGRECVHDAQRKNAAGEGSWQKVTRHARRLIDGRGDREYYIRGTYTAANLDFTEDVRCIADLGFDQISLEPVVAEGPLSLTEAHLPALSAEYQRLGDLIEQRRAEGRPFNFFHFMMDFTGGPCLNKRLRGCGAGVEYAAITPEGDVYPCHQFVGHEQFRMGSVLDGGEPDARIAEQFAGCHVYNKPACAQCWAKYYCSGGCAANAFKTNGDILSPHKLSCEIERMRLDAAIGLYIRRQNAQTAKL